MTIPLTGAGSLFVRLGHMAKVLSDANSYAKTTLTTDVTNIYADFVTGYANESIIDGIGVQLTAAQASSLGFPNYISQLATNTCNAMVQADNPQFSSSSIDLALQEIIRQMKASSDSVLPMTVACTSSAAAGNNGNGNLVCTTYRKDGLQQENIYAEKIKAVCTADSSNGATTAGNEQFTVTGTTSVTLLSSSWPGGSGASGSLQVINPTTGSILSNGAFETWTVANTPDDFSITVGSAGTQVLEGSTPFTGTKSLELVGDAANTALTQTITTSTQTLYAVNCWIYASVTPAAGVLEFALIDGGGNVINDDQGNQNLFTKSLTAVTTTWLAVSGIFRTPLIQPAVVKLRIRLSTALSVGTNLFIDQLCLSEMTSLYSFGPSFALFSGSTNFFLGDYFTATATNSRGAAGTLNTWQTVFFRLFNRTNLLLPVDPSPTINDNLIA